MKKPEEIKKGLVEAIEEASWAVEGGDAHDLIDAVENAHASMADALAYIQQLEAQVPRWIPVEERLPENYATVIIFREDCRNACIGWLIGGSWSVPKGVRVTHWMPLPEGPKEDAHD